MKRTVLCSLMALALVLGLTLSMATPVMAGFDPVTEKEVVWEDTDGHPEGVYLVNQDIVYVLRLINNAADPLEVHWIRDRFALDTAALEEAVWDPVLGDWTPWDPNEPPPVFSIDAGETWSQSVAQAIGPEHLIDLPNIPDAMWVRNQVQVVGFVEHEEYTRNIFETVQVIQPGIELEKTVEPAGAQVGETVTYTFTITNTGDWPLEEITIEDDELPDVDLQDKLPADLVLAKHGEEGDSFTFQYDYEIQAGDHPLLENEATVWGTAQDFDPDVLAAAVVSFSATAEVEIDIPVGGTVYPMNALIIVLPGLALAVVIAGIVVYVRSRRGRS